MLTHPATIPTRWRLPEEVFDDIKDVKVDKQNLAMAETLIERRKASSTSPCSRTATRAP